MSPLYINLQFPSVVFKYCISTIGFDNISNNGFCIGVLHIGSYYAYFDTERLRYRL